MRFPHLLPQRPEAGFLGLHTRGPRCERRGAGVGPARRPRPGPRAVCAAAAAASAPLRVSRLKEQMEGSLPASQPSSETQLFVFAPIQKNIFSPEMRRDERSA